MTEETIGEHAFRVRLDAFDGPLDLLLTLIKEQQLDVATVPLASVAEQYLDYVRMMHGLDVELAAEYLVIARDRVSLLASMDYIMRRIKERGEVYFSQLCDELGMTRDVVIVTFLAILELIRRRRVRFEQTEPFDDIRLWGKAA